MRVEGTDPRACRHLETFLAPFVGKALDGKRLDRDLTRLTGIGKFSRVGYRVVRENGREGLLVTVEENGYAPPMLQPGFELDGSDVGSVGFTVGARLTVMDMGGYRSEWRTDVSFGTVYGIRSEYYRPFTASSKWFAAPEVVATSSSLRIEGRTDPVAEYRVRYAGAGADLGYGFSRFSRRASGTRSGISTRACGWARRCWAATRAGARERPAPARPLRPDGRSRDPAARGRGRVIPALVRRRARARRTAFAPDPARVSLPAHHASLVRVRRRGRRHDVRREGHRPGPVLARRDQRASRLRCERAARQRIRAAVGRLPSRLSGGCRRSSGKKVHVVAQVEAAKMGGEPGGRPTSPSASWPRPCSVRSSSASAPATRATGAGSSSSAACSRPGARGRAGSSPRSARPRRAGSAWSPGT